MENEKLRQWSAHNLINSYESLFSRAQRTKGNLQPFLLQLSNYDERDITAWKSLVELSQDIATKALATGMMKGISEATIKRRIKVFLNPEAGTKNHSRPIFPAQALKSKLDVEEQDVRSASMEFDYGFVHATGKLRDTAGQQGHRIFGRSFFLCRSEGEEDESEGYSFHKEGHARFC